MNIIGIDRGTSNSAPAVLRGYDYSPERRSASSLQKIKRDAEAFMGSGKEDRQAAHGRGSRTLRRVRQETPRGGREVAGQLRRQAYRRDPEAH